MWIGKRHYRTAIAWQIGVAVYMQLVSWVPLGRWNYQPCCPTGLEQLRRGMLSASDAAGMGLFLLPAVLFWVGTRREWKWAMWVALSAIAVWLGLQLWSWWPPYLFGASERWAAVYARAFAHATPILPRWGNHLPPDAMHVVLQILLSGSLVTGAMAVLQQSERDPSRR